MSYLNVFGVQFFPGFQLRPHLLLSGRTVHPEIPEGDTEDEIAQAAKMKEARGIVIQWQRILPVATRHEHEVHNAIHQL